MGKMLSRDDLGVLKAEALVLAATASNFAGTIRREGHMNFHPDANDYDELAKMIRRLADALPL